MLIKLVSWSCLVAIGLSPQEIRGASQMDVSNHVNGKTSDYQLNEMINRGFFDTDNEELANKDVTEEFESDDNSWNGTNTYLSDHEYSINGTQTNNSTNGNFDIYQYPADGTQPYNTTDGNSGSFEYPTNGTQPSNNTSSQSQKLRGVNLGGWLILERWLTPSLYNGMPESAVDEWNFCQILGKAECAKRLQAHWKSWVTFDDLKALRGAGINLLRIPIGYWSFDCSNDEPYVEGAIEYMVQAIQWARELGMQVMVDFHGLPGSQNGFDNSGKKGDVKWTWNNGTVERGLSVVQKIMEQVLIPNQNTGVINSFELVNEPLGSALDKAKLADYYNKGYQMINSRLPQLKVIMHDTFKPIPQWNELPVSKDWHQAWVDTHIYHLYTDAMLALDAKGHFDLAKQHEQQLVSSPYPFIVGEWSLATGRCKQWNADHTKCNEEVGAIPFDDEYRQFLKNFFNAQVAAYEANGQGWVYWNFKTETSKEWSYLDGLKEGWINKFN